jgi:hypothetical protein
MGRAAHSTNRKQEYEANRVKGKTDSDWLKSKGDKLESG